MTADARAAIETLIYTYAERLDLGDLDGVGRLFADATYGPDGAEPLRGAQAVTDIMTASVQLHDGVPRTKHVTSNLIIALSDDSATARSYFTVFQATDDVSLQPIVQGRYHDSFRCRDGEWSFAARVVFMDAVGDVSRHLKFDVSDFVGSS
jgi:3-phenylpropionate/cinnamic acid dioxygenase small subunit